MLKRIHINNIALIQELELSFDSGLIVLSGETGAGKSIIIDSFNFVLGGRADKTLITHGQQEARVEAVFGIDDRIRQELLEFGIEAEDEIVVYRSLSIAGKSDSRINGRAVTLGMLKSITSQMINIHGQHEHQHLLKIQNHIKTLDNLSGSALCEKKEQFTKLLSEYKEIKKELTALGGTEEDRERSIDILEYQIREISTADLNEEEERKLEAERVIAANSERILESLGGGLELLNLEGNKGLSLIESIGKARQHLVSIQRFDESIAELAERLNSVQIELDDIVEALSAYSSEISADMLNIDEIENRLEVYKELKRKYGKTLQEVFAFCKSAEQKLETLKNSKEIILGLEKRKSELFKKLQAVGKELTEERISSALRLKKETEFELHELGMVGAQFSVEFGVADYSEEAITPSGFDNVEFYFSANAGEPLKPLSKIISGGEMSRFMLALKVITSKTDEIETLIFDEIDTGISGKAGTVVAAKMARISRSAQVICVTHLSSIAAMADSNYLVTKLEKNSKTTTKVIALDRNGMIEEISRLIGGAEISSHSIKHSEELKSWCDDFKKQLLSNK